MEKGRSTHVAFVKLAAQARHNAHRKFQPFGAVDAHNSHHVCRAGQRGCGSQVVLSLLEPVDESKKTGQASIAHTLVLLRVLGQKQQIRLALGPARHGLDHGGVPGLLIDFV